MIRLPAALSARSAARARRSKDYDQRRPMRHRGRTISRTLVSSIHHVALVRTDFVIQSTPAVAGVRVADPPAGAGGVGRFIIAPPRDPGTSPAGLRVRWAFLAWDSARSLRSSRFARGDKVGDRRCAQILR